MIRRLPFFYGWVIVAIVFVTVAISVTARTSFSLLVPPVIDEFGWDRELVAGAFSAGFLLSALLGPVIGKMMDRYGPAVVVETGVFCVGAGLIGAAWVDTPWLFYLTLGIGVVTGANFMSYTAQSMYLPNWFQTHRALAISLAFSGAGFGGYLLLPQIQSVIENEGWRTACLYMGILTIVVLAPLNLLLRRKPEDIGLLPYGMEAGQDGAPPVSKHRIVDADWVAVEWTLARALRTTRFWWLTVGFFCALTVWYMVQVHQTRYLLDVGYSGAIAADALGLVVLVAIGGQVGLGALSDRLGREAVWATSSFGFGICYSCLLAMQYDQSEFLLYTMVISQGLLGYAMTSVLGPIVAEIFEGPHYGAIFGTVTVALVGGGAAGPWLGGFIFDRTGSYELAFQIAIGLCFLSAFAIWRAAPRKVRSVRMG
jgi:MFS family permease